MIAKLVDELPELGEHVRAGLMQQARTDLLPALLSAEVHAVALQSHHAAIELVPNFDGGAMMAHPDRERLGIGAPRGVRRRGWVISLDVINGQIWLLALSYPGILRDPLRRLARRLDRGSGGAR